MEENKKTLGLSKIEREHALPLIQGQFDKI